VPGYAGAVFPGEPVTLTATVSNLNPGKARFTLVGNRVSGNGETATVATGSWVRTYTVNAEVKETKPSGIACG